ncbi:hypothetical protein [Lactiplantibacillus paraplantarum]|uniref:Uncharacterized protein n=1 Tax=Lactiplantibacillus paraplantarum TaxID=60520 RepID=A0A2I9CMP2_9LACO|nr:hypothetical protein [Lactiplantibacillus paraplantarum]AVW11544.1 hypothetical protein DA077_13795 [Lactiplantibacillus paraplantarum]AYJ39962.1 hypothetical protein LP667_14735 [Lactiplantibacillus paraplantarum]ERL43392.1 hypothetical protein N644_2534 [Lactiplantibacillus paraplantarum]KRL49147.1 hypothetical protein FD48_GL000952 [Lactiplantibacillus paraplantarum DSM 10667]MCU4685030.1 hypothetical protein [Lactiplantibacillus paraplantarum]
MTTVTALEDQAGQVLDQSYTQFKQAQLALGKEQVFANAAQIFAVGEIATATRQYLFDEEIARQVIKLQDQVLLIMYQQGQNGEFLKLNFTGNDIRWLLGLPRTHHRQRLPK